MLQFTMPSWVDNISKVDSNSEEGLKFHRSIFEMIILDLQPWSIVNNPGFLRHHAVFTPHFDIGSEKYYQSMLNPAYEKIKLAMKVMLNEKNAETVSISLDAWSFFHHEYLGMMAHFISDQWERIKFCLSYSNFDEKHIASNIFQRLENVAKEL